MKSPLLRGLFGVFLVSLVMVAIWWFWIGRHGRDWWGVVPTASLDRLEKTGVPDFTLPRVEGGDFRLSSLQGKLIIINFWASWCAPCVKEFPSMLKLVDHYKGRLKLVAISADDNKEDILNFVKAFNGQRPGVELLWDPSMKVAHEYGTDQLPESYIVNSKRKLIRKVVGEENWFSENAVEFMDQYIGSKR